MKKGVKTIIAGVLLGVAGVAIIPATIVAPILKGVAQDHPFLAPGGREVSIAKPGQYYLWNEYDTMFEGKSYQHDVALPTGLEVTVRDESGEVLAFTAYDKISMSIGNGSKKSVGYVEVTEPSTLQVDVTGDFEPRVFSFAHSPVKEMAMRFLRAAVIAALSGLLAIGLVIWGIVKVTRANRAQLIAAQPSANPPPLG